MAKINKTYKPGDEFTPDSVNEIIAAVNDIDRASSINYSSSIMELKDNKDITNKTYIVEHKCWLQCYVKTASVSGTPFARLRINGNVIFEGSGIEGTYKYLWTPLFPVEAGDTVIYSLSTNEDKGEKALRLYFQR